MYPPHNGTDTSQAAAVSVAEHLPRLEGLVMTAIGPLYSDGTPKDIHGATCDEVEWHTGLSHQCASARINALARRRLIRDSGQRRPTRSGRKAIVWEPAS
jgi:hypothetical protein